MRTRPAMLLLLALTVACGYRPARFRDAPVVLEAEDSLAIPQPRQREFIKELREADVYVRRELVGGLDPRRPPRAYDVNALDQVVRSAWFNPPADDRSPLDTYVIYGPPRPPFRLVDDPPLSGTPGARVILDARGYGYELLADDEDRPGMRTGAFVIASRLLHAIGYRTPEAHIIRASDGERVAAIRWPVGVDLGPTATTNRSDDPNDVLPHLDRRSLRALTMVTAWLGMKRLRLRTLRDVYVGSQGRGHVEHWVVGLDGALGVDDYLDAVSFAQDPDREYSNFFLRLFSMGLSPKPPPTMPQTLFDSVGFLSENVDEDHYAPSPPFEPRDYMQPADAYWAAKRIAKVPQQAIADAIVAADLDPLAGNWLFQVLNLRRASVIAKGYGQTTPCELVTLEHEDDGDVVVIVADLAVSNGFVKAWQSSYDVQLLDDAGDRVAPDRTLVSPSSLLRIPIAKQVLDRDYLVLRLHGRRRNNPLPNAYEVHFIPDNGRLRLVGTTH